MPRKISLAGVDRFNAEGILPILRISSYTCTTTPSKERLELFLDSISRGFPAGPVRAFYAKAKASPTRAELEVLLGTMKMRLSWHVRQVLNAAIRPLHGSHLVESRGHHGNSFCVKRVPGQLTVRCLGWERVCLSSPRVEGLSCSN